MEKQSVDFDELTKSGLFGIFGPTGSGKTTILDGITLALYGKIARKSKNFINANSENATIVFEFQITGNVVKRYRVERVFKTDKKTGGVKTSKSLLIDVTGEPEVLADKKTEVDNLCQDIIGLNSEDFQRTVVLPQGKFSDFLKLEGNERSKMLERLFGLEEYGDQLTFRLKRKREAEELQMADVEGQLKTYDGISENSLLEQQDVYEELKKLLMKQQTAQKQILDEYEKKKEEVISAIVTKRDDTTGDVEVDTGTSTAWLARAEQLPGDNLHVGDRIRVFVSEVKRDIDEAGPLVTLSRIHPNMLKRMFETDIPEIADGIVLIKGVAREAGSRSKIAVMSRDPEVDAVGACIGNRGMRINAIVEELHGEKIDVIAYSDTPETYIAAALSPATVLEVEFDGERSAKAIVSGDQLSLAIGKEGQNVRLAAKLTGCKIDIRGVKAAE